MNNGWITIHRSIRDHWLYSNNEYFSAWIKMLFEVSFKDSKPTLIKGKLVECKRGQSIKSLDTWVNVFGRGWSKQKVRTFFKLLSRDEIINTENIGVTTRLTICKYDDYQLSQHEHNTQTTRDQHALNTHLTPEEKGNKENKGKKGNNPRELIAFAQGLVSDPERKELIKEWLEYRIEIKKPMKTERGLNAMVKEWSGYTNIQLKGAINFSMAKEYQGIIFGKSEKSQENDSTGVLL